MSYTSFFLQQMSSTSLFLQQMSYTSLFLQQMSYTSLFLLLTPENVFFARRLGHFGKKGYICGTQAFGWGKDENLTTIRNDYETHFADMLHGHGGHALLCNSRGTAAAGNRYDSGRRAGGQSHPRALCRQHLYIQPPLPAREGLPTPRQHGLLQGRDDMVQRLCGQGRPPRPHRHEPGALRRPARPNGRDGGHAQGEARPWPRLGLVQARQAAHLGILRNQGLHALHAQLGRRMGLLARAAGVRGAKGRGRLLGAHHGRPRLPQANALGQGQGRRRQGPGALLPRGRAPRHGTALADGLRRDRARRRTAAGRGHAHHGRRQARGSGDAARGPRGVRLHARRGQRHANAHRLGRAVARV